MLLKGLFGLNDETGKWSGSTYYGSFPEWVTTYNEPDGLDFRIGNLVWGLICLLRLINMSLLMQSSLLSSMIFLMSEHEKYKKFKTSPYANDEVTTG